MVHPHARMMEGKKIPQMNSTKECFYIYISLSRNCNHRIWLDCTSQVKTAADTLNGELTSNLKKYVP